MRVPVRISLLLIGLWLGASGPCVAKLSLVVLGDSISAGYGIDPEHGWVQNLQQHLILSGYSINVINASINGATTENGLDNLPVLMQRYQPTWLIVELGANDGLRGLSLQAMQTNLAQIVQAATRQGILVLLLGVRLPVNYGPDFIEQFYAIYPAVSQQHSVALVPFIMERFAADLSYFQPDGLHPTQAAQSMMFETIWPYLKPLLDQKYALAQKLN